MDEISIELEQCINSFFENDFSAIDWDEKPSAEKWSKKEIAGHLIDSAQINLQRFTRCTYEENFKLIYHQNEWVQAQHYQEAETEELLSLWKSLNLQIIRVLKYYPLNRLEITCDTGKIDQSLHTVQWLAQDYIRHMDHHLRQITA